MDTKVKYECRLDKLRGNIIVGIHEVHEDKEIRVGNMRGLDGEVRAFPTSEMAERYAKKLEDALNKEQQEYEEKVEKIVKKAEKKVKSKKKTGDAK